MHKLLKASALLILFIICPSLYADENANAILQQTQDCLRNQNCASATTQEGQSAAQKALGTVDGDTVSNQELYNLAAEILPSLVGQSAGDPVKMQAILEESQAHPENFLNSLPSEIQTKIKNLAATVGTKQKSGQ